MAAVSSAEREMNLSALQQRDPYITGIADSASQVAVYSFNSTIHEWEKTNVEGTLFVYSRSANPINGFMIINRLHLNDLIEPINKNLEFQLQDPFLLYRNEKAIYGIWFYDRDECARIGQLMNSLVQIAIETQQKESTSGRQRRASESDTTIDSRSSDAAKGVDAVQKNVDILQMLSKAQDEYDKSKGQGLRKSSTPTVMTNGNCSAAVGACSTSPVSRAKGATSSKPSEADHLGAGKMKSSRVLRPTAVKPAPLQIDSSKRGVGGPDPNMTPNTQISLEALFKRAVLQQDGNPPSNSYRAPQSASIQMVPSVAQLMSSQTGTTTVEELERQHHKNPQQQDVPRPGGPDAVPTAAVNGAVFCNSLSFTGETESPNTMLRRTLNLDSAFVDQNPVLLPQQPKPVQNCVGQLPFARQKQQPQQQQQQQHLHQLVLDPFKANLSIEKKSNADAAPFPSPAGLPSQTNPLVSPLGLAAPPCAIGSSPAASVSATPLVSSFIGCASTGSTRDGTNSVKPGLATPGIPPIGSGTWPSSSQNDVLAPPETFQVAALKNESVNVLLSPMVFQASAGLSILNHPKPIEQRMSDSSSGNGSLPPVQSRSPFGMVAAAETASLPINPLSRDQLQQALIHLLKNDSNFLTAIHDAYVASLNQELGSKFTRP